MVKSLRRYDLEANVKMWRDMNIEVSIELYSTKILSLSPSLTLALSLSLTLNLNLNLADTSTLRR